MAEKARQEGGFLLVEALWAVLLLTIVFGLFASLSSMITDRNSTLTAQTYLAEEARPTLDNMANELEAATCDYGGQGHAPIWSADGTSITFTAPDHEQPFRLRKISYAFFNGALYRQVQLSSNTSATGPPWQWNNAALPLSTAVENVTNVFGSQPVFQYYDSDGNTLAAQFGLSTPELQAVAKVTMTVFVRPPSSIGTGASGLVPSNSLTVQASAALRTPYTTDCT
jgi:type II secretory pathway component PulJ